MSRNEELTLTQVERAAATSAPVGSSVTASIKILRTSQADLQLDRAEGPQRYAGLAPNLGGDPGGAKMVNDEADVRTVILDAHAAAEAGRTQLLADHRAHPTDELRLAHVLLDTYVQDLRDRYLDLIPYRGVSRCPFTGLVVIYPIDDFGLDGLWWRLEAPERPIADLPPTLFALTGAVDIVEPVEPAPFVVRPGPGAPYVVPRLLAEPHSAAVVSSFPIGRHTAYCIAYFAAQPLESFAVAAEWGTDQWTLRYPQGSLGTVALSELESERDFDLEPWLATGRLQWIAPGDDTLELRTGTDGCPYVDATGRRHEVVVDHGVLR